MEGGASSSKQAKFAVYQNPSLSAALTANSLRTSKSTFIFIVALSSASAFSLLSSVSRENWIIDHLKLAYISQEVAYSSTKVVQAIMALVLFGTIMAFIKAIWLWGARVAAGPKALKEPKHLSYRQLGLLGIRPKVEQVVSDSSKKPPISKINSSPSNVLVPLHQPITTAVRSSHLSSDKSISASGTKMRSFGFPSKSPASPSLYLVPATTAHSPSIQTSPGHDHMFSIPWSNKRSSSAKEISSVVQFEQFLANVDERFSESVGKMATPPPTITGFGIASPSTMTMSTNTSSTTRSTPLRPVRMSPGSQKFNTPPKKGEGDLPPPMSMEESIEAFERLGIYPQIEQWRDCLRQWFSSALLNPLLMKIETSHIKVMEAAAKLGISVTIKQVGSDSTVGTSATVSSLERTNEWQPAYTLDEEGLLQQLRNSLVQTLDASMARFSIGYPQQSAQSPVPILQECIDAITEHQRLCTLVKGEWAKGLLPHSSVWADYTVQRIRELAEGTCVKNYEYVGSSDAYGKLNKKWTELPTDSHLLLYLFCAFLEHPKWMLHVDPTSHVGGQSSKNPLFLGVLPPKERFPEKYLAIISAVPSVIHPGACILAVGKQTRPVFALYWDKKPQFSLQGRTALWDSILLLCHRIKIEYGGIVRGMHLGSSAFSILPVLDLENDSDIFKAVCNL